MFRLVAILSELTAKQFETHSYKLIKCYGCGSTDYVKIYIT
jgi:hypothetical protein